MLHRGLRSAALGKYNIQASTITGHIYQLFLHLALVHRDMWLYHTTPIKEIATLSVSHVILIPIHEVSQCVVTQMHIRNAPSITVERPSHGDFHYQPISIPQLMTFAGLRLCSAEILYV